MTSVRGVTEWLRRAIDIYLWTGEFHRNCGVPERGQKLLEHLARVVLGPLAEPGILGRRRDLVLGQLVNLLQPVGVGLEQVADAVQRAPVLLVDVALVVVDPRVAQLRRGQ